jgi:MinD-like ATPase involved in chromosome partitioning or flagellar assembly
MPNVVIAFANGKGGTGKTTHCALLSSILCEQEECQIVGVDLDKQRDFTARMANRIPVYTSMDEIPDNATIIVDTAPGVVSSPEIIKVIKNATILIIPTRGDMRGVQSAASVYDLRRTETQKPTRILINEYNNLSRERQALEWLSNEYHGDVYTFPRLEGIITNLDLNRRWAIQLPIKRRVWIKEFYNILLKV